MKSIVIKFNRTGLEPLFCLFIIFFLLVGTLSPASAEVAGWKVSPENPEIGDILTITGLASPEEEVGISISFEKKVPVYLRKYAYEFEKIEILNFNSLFTVKAEGVENIKVKMKMVLSKTESAWADNEIAAVSFSRIPPGEYKVKIEGIAKNGASGINLKVTTVQKLKAGQDGKFSYMYRTEQVPSGKLEIKVGNSEKEIIMDAKKGSSLLQAPLTSSANSQILTGPEAFAASEPVALTNPELANMDILITELMDGELSDAEPADATELAHRGAEEKNNIYIAGNSWDEDMSMATIAGEVPSKKSTKNKEIQEHENQSTNFLYLLAGVLGGVGILWAIKKK